jgi:hypothetical protein
MLVLLLKGNNPDKFKEKTAITVRRIKGGRHNHSEGSPWRGPQAPPHEE